jgi:Sulfotransferase domain
MDRQFVSFPKSGRSWLRYALHRLGVADKIFFHHDGFEYNDGTKSPLDFDFSKRLDRYDLSKAIVYLHRDPRDVMVSLYFQVTGRFTDFFHFNGTISDFIRDPYFGAENLQRFRSQWVALCEDGRALAIAYEACHSDFPRALRMVVAHYRFDICEEAIIAATKEAAFENMQSLERSGRFVEPWLQLRNGAPKVRRGKVGGFASELLPTDIDYLNHIFFSNPKNNT